jgi:hypothetical protein
MIPGSDTGRVLRHLCAVTRGGGLVVIDCRTDVAQPLALSEDALWDAIDTLLAEGLIEPAQQRGIRVRLTTRGAAWCRSLPRRLHMLRMTFSAQAGP